MVERKTALEIRLELGCAAAHVPRAVRPLRAEQVLHPALIRRVGSRQNAAFPKRPQGFASSIGIACEIAILRPAAIGALCRHQSPTERSDFLRRRASPVQTG